MADAYSSRPPLSGELQQDSHDGEGRASDNVSSAGLPSFRRAESSDLSGCQVVPTGTQPAQPAAKEVGPPVSKFAADTLRPSDHVADGHPEKPAARPTSSQLISPPASPPPVAKEEGEQQQKQQEEGRTPEQESYDAQVGETQQAGNEAIIEGEEQQATSRHAVLAPTDASATDAPEKEGAPRDGTTAADSRGRALRLRDQLVACLGKLREALVVCFDALKQRLAACHAPSLVTSGGGSRGDGQHNEHHYARAARAHAETIGSGTRGRQKLARAPCSQGMAHQGRGLIGSFESMVRPCVFLSVSLSLPRTDPSLA